MKYDLQTMKRLIKEEIDKVPDMSNDDLSYRVKLISSLETMEEKKLYKSLDIAIAKERKKRHNEREALKPKVQEIEEVK